MNLRTIYETYKEHFDVQPDKSNEKKRKKELAKSQHVEATITDAQITTIQSHYPTDYTSSSVSLSTMNEDEDTVMENQGLQPVEIKSIEPNLNEIAVDESRIIYPNAGLSGLYEFVPATKIKGNLYILFLYILFRK